MILNFGGDMPTISVFYGIIVRMFFDEHAPPHFHVEYGEYKAVFDIRTLELTDGDFPRRAQGLVLDWSRLHQRELLENWELCRQHLEPRKIDPLR
jgi:hypothetical protein